MIPLQEIGLELISDSIFAHLSDVRYMIGYLNPNNNSPENDIEDWAIGGNENSEVFTDQEIMEQA